MIFPAAWGEKKPLYLDKFYLCGCGYSTTRRQALLVGVGRHLLPFAQCLAAQMDADPWVSLQSLLWCPHPHTHTLPSLRAAGEEVSGHLAFPLHLDETATVQLVSIAVQHVVKVCGHLTKDTDIDKVSHVLSKQNTSISSSDQAVNKLNVVQSATK